jgi:hypothetical protein
LEALQLYFCSVAFLVATVLHFFNKRHRGVVFLLAFNFILQPPLITHQGEVLSAFKMTKNAFFIHGNLVKNLLVRLSKWAHQKQTGQ